MAPTPCPRSQSVPCEKKLTLVEQQMPCRCKKTYCTHRLAASHDCTFNYIDSAKEKLKEGMPAATFQKVESVSSRKQCLKEKVKMFYCLFSSLFF